MVTSMTEAVHHQLTSAGEINRQWKEGAITTQEAVRALITAGRILEALDKKIFAEAQAIAWRCLPHNKQAELYTEAMDVLPPMK